MSVFKTKLFQGWQKKEDIPDESLCVAVAEMSRGLISGFRTLLATNKNDKWFFVYGFAKNERDNIENREVQALKRLAAVLLGMDVNAINQLLADKELKEICKDEK